MIMAVTDLVTSPRVLARSQSEPYDANTFLVATGRTASHFEARAQELSHDTGADGSRGSYGRSKKM